MSDRWLGWHFLPADRRLRGSREVVEAGRTYRVEGSLVMCGNGMHASRRALDALQYAPGPVISRVELLGERVDDVDKSCARERLVFWIADATTILHEFALAVAVDALCDADARGAVVDPRAWAAIETKRRWLYGVATDAKLDTARRAAAWNATNIPWTVIEATRRVAWIAVWAATRAIIWGAARNVTQLAARDVVRATQNMMLKTMLESLKQEEQR